MVVAPSHMLLKLHQTQPYQNRSPAEEQDLIINGNNPILCQVYLRDGRVLLSEGHVLMKLQHGIVELQGLRLVVGVEEDLGDSHELAPIRGVGGADSYCEHLYVFTEEAVVVLAADEKNVTFCSFCGRRQKPFPCGKGVVSTIVAFRR